jgi:predicted ThiF/HesA family dinucleotide-utilizing enzyme
VRPALEPTDAVRLGRRVLDGQSGVALLADLTWMPGDGCWALLLRLRANTHGSAIPEWTDWYVLIDEHYPLGSIHVHPAKSHGIEATYPHQRLNQPGPASRPWRDGRLCLQTGLASLGALARREEPLTPEDRLAWHVERTREWLEAAASGQLLAPGHSFELPDLPVRERTRVVFSEGAQTFDAWGASSGARGWAELVPLPGASRVLAVRAFYSFEGRWLFSPEWGDVLSRVPRKRRQRVPWLFCQTLPMLPPHAAPTTWQELEVAAVAQQWRLREELMAFAPRLRDGKRHLCLLGFPIPALAGAANVRMHWWAVRLPLFSHGNVAPRGYRRNERTRWLHDQKALFGRPLPVDWLQTDNWAPAELRSRGALPEDLRRSWVLLLGAGSLGSAVAELLVRGGVSRLVILDPDVVEAGNLARHTLALADVGAPKARALAERLRAISPELQVHAFRQPLALTAERNPWLVSRCDTIIDCTASNEVIEALGQMAWERSRLFFSASFGVGARRILCFGATGPSFPAAAFWKQSEAWREHEYEELLRSELPREGIGCWHSVFPARADDVMLAAAIAVKALVRCVRTRPSLRFDSYTCQDDDSGFQGVAHVPVVDAHVEP